MVWKLERIWRGNWMRKLVTTRQRCVQRRLELNNIKVLILQKLLNSFCALNASEELSIARSKWVTMKQFTLSLYHHQGRNQRLRRPVISLKKLVRRCQCAGELRQKVRMSFMHLNLMVRNLQKGLQCFTVLLDLQVKLQIFVFRLID